MLTYAFTCATLNPIVVQNIIPEISLMPLSVSFWPCLLGETTVLNFSTLDYFLACARTSHNWNHAIWTLASFVYHNFFFEIYPCVSWNNGSLIFIAEQYSTGGIFCSVFIHSPIETSCFWFGAVVNRVAVNILYSCSVDIYVFICFHCS